ncbi:MAG: hypothetical protein ACI9RO_000993, partial [Alteromonas macleodii]
PNPSSNPKPIHSSRHTQYRSRKLNPSKERGRLTFVRFLQQSLTKD